MEESLGYDSNPGEESSDAAVHGYCQVTEARVPSSCSQAQETDNHMDWVDEAVGAGPRFGFLWFLDFHGSISEPAKTVKALYSMETRLYHFCFMQDVGKRGKKRRGSTGLQSPPPPAPLFRPLGFYQQAAAVMLRACHASLLSPHNLSTRRSTLPREAGIQESRSVRRSRRHARPKGNGWGARVGRISLGRGGGGWGLMVAFITLIAWQWSYLGVANAAAVAVDTSGGPARSLADSATRMTLRESIDTAFYMFVESLAKVLDKESSLPWDQAAVMFSAAWVTTSVAPIAAAGLLGQPLGRAMVATATCHASYAAYKFFLAVVAVLGFQVPDSQTLPNYDGVPSQAPATPDSRFEKGSGSDKPPTRFFEPVERRRTRAGVRARRSPVKRVEASRGGTRSEMKQRSQVMYTRRVSPAMIPRLWLMLVTAMGGPAIGAVLAVAAYSKGHTVLMAAFSSLIRGSLLGTLAAGTLCFGAAGTELVVKWAVFQGIVGALFAAILSPSMLAFLAIYMYYRGLRTTGQHPRGGDGEQGKQGHEAGGETGRETGGETGRETGDEAATAGDSDRDRDTRQNSGSRPKKES